METTAKSESITPYPSTTVKILLGVVIACEAGAIGGIYKSFKDITANEAQEKAIYSAAITDMKNGDTSQAGRMADSLMRKGDLDRAIDIAIRLRQTDRAFNYLQNDEN